MAKDHSVTEINLRTYCKDHVVALYSSKESLLKPEKSILTKIRNEISTKNILDIGVGAGRTTPYLMEISPKYTAIDYSPDLLRKFKDKYPEVSAFHCDARNMSIFGDEEFDFILFSFNGIDSVSHVDRLLILREIFRVLKKDGYFVFSTHNNSVVDLKRFSSPLGLLPYTTPRDILRRIFIPITYNPLIILKRSINYLLDYRRKIKYRTVGGGIIRGIVNHLKNKKHEVHTNEYSIINDIALNFSLMSYYITIDNQEKQLRDVGFSKSIKAYDIDGMEVAEDSRSPWIYYLANK